MSGRRRRERGYASVAAVFACACFAVIAAQAARTSRSGVASVNAEVAHARLQAAADAGLATALDHILADDSGSRWPEDGTPQEVGFDDARLRVAVEDERGKIPLNRLSSDEARAMFEQAGVDPASLGPVTAIYMAQLDPDTRGGPVKGGQAAQDEGGGFRAVQELRRLPGVTPAVFAALAPYATVDAGDVRFEPRVASPFARKVMTGGGAGDAVGEIERQRSAEGERAAFEAPAAVEAPLTGRVFTIRVEAADARGGRVRDATIVQITGRPQQPYIVRQHYGAPEPG